MANETRVAKINDEIRRELGTLIPRLKDPRIQGLVSVTRVDTTRDMRYAKVYISVMSETADKDGVIKGLSSAAGFLRHEIGQKLALRMLPELKFIADDSMERGARIIDVLRSINESGEQDDAD